MEKKTRLLVLECFVNYLSWVNLYYNPFACSSVISPHPNTHLPKKNPQWKHCSALSQSDEDFLVKPHFLRTISFSTSNRNSIRNDIISILDICWIVITFYYQANPFIGLWWGLNSYLIIKDFISEVNEDLCIIKIYYFLVKVLLQYKTMFFIKYISLHKVWRSSLNWFL